MCTAILHGRYAGRNLDVDKNYGEEVIITPRNFAISFKLMPTVHTHHAIIGMGISVDEYPLYFDAANEQGLYISGLNYLGNAKYMPEAVGKINLAPYELMIYLLAKCSSVADAERELAKINLVGIPFRHDIPLAELHFFIADKGGAIVLEPDADGLNIYKSPTGVLTNNPPFPMQLFNLNNYMSLSSEPAKNRICPSLPLTNYSFGMGAIGLPGDLSSMSRFVRASFHRSNSKSDAHLTDIMHLLSSVAMPYGSVRLGDGYEYTEYSSAVDLSELVYSYRTYDSLSTYAVRLCDENIHGSDLIKYSLKREKEPFITNSSLINVSY